MSPKAPVRVLYHSFRSFLMGPKKREAHPFWMDKKVLHAQMATNCLKAMTGHPRNDRCEIKDPEKGHSSMDPKETKSRLQQRDNMLAFIRFIRYNMRASQSKMMIASTDFIVALTQMGRSVEPYRKALGNSQDSQGLAVSLLYELHWIVVEYYVLIKSQTG